MALGLFQLACQKKGETITTESGMVLNFTKKGEYVGFTEKDVVLLNLKIETEDGKAFIDSEADGDSKPIQYDSQIWEEGGLFYEALNQCSVGDSLNFMVSTSDFFIKTFKSTVPDSIQEGSNLKITVGIESAMTGEAFNIMMTERQVGKEEKQIEDFLSENDLKAQKTESGLRYIITEQGEGVQPNSGQVVVVHYRGAFLDDREFDSSYSRDQPLEFPLGQGRVIRGWDEGIALLNVGSKATFLIPSALAYGQRGAPGAIPPNSILKFDVELLDVKEDK